MQLPPSKLPRVGNSIFSTMSALARKHDAVNLSQGFPSFDVAQELKDRVYHHMNQGMNQYALMPGLPKLRSGIAQKIEAAYGSAIDPESEVTVVAGATQGLFAAIGSLVHPGDEVILIEPAYDSYRPTVELFGGIPVVYETKLPDFTVDWSELGKLISPKTRMLIVNTPHNPTARAYTEADWQAITTLTRGTNILVLSDEVYEHLVFDGRAHKSILKYPQLANRALAVYSFGKTFHATGWKVGYVVAPTPITQELRKFHLNNVFAVNSPMQYGIADYLEQPDTYMDLPDFFQQKRDFLLAQLQESPFTPIACEGSYFLLASYAGISNAPDTEFANWLTVEHGVATIPISVFYSSGRDEHVVRFCFAKSEEILAEAGKRLRGVR